MSLNFQFTDKAKYDSMTADDKSHNDLFIWGCLAVDMGNITEKNAEEWHWRYCFYSKLFGSFYNLPGGKPYIPSLEDVKKRIGLDTNCTTKMQGQFVKKIVKMFKA